MEIVNQEDTINWDTYEIISNCIHHDVNSVLRAMGEGKSLHIAKDSSSAFCMMPSNCVRGIRDFPVSVTVRIALEVVKLHGPEGDNIISLAEEEDIPKKHKKMEGYKAGWKSSNLPGDTFHIWRFVQ